MRDVVDIGDKFWKRKPGLELSVCAGVLLSARVLIPNLRVVGRTEPIPVVVKEELMGFGRLQMEVIILNPQARDGFYFLMKIHCEEELANKWVRILGFYFYFFTPNEVSM